MQTSIIIPVRFHYNPQPLRTAQKAQKLDNRELAQERGCHEVTISRVMKGRAQSPEIVLWLCERLGVAVGEVIQEPEGGWQKNLATR